jgi:hypothetical protein
LTNSRHPGQLRHHPLRGAVFETWVISEILEARLHRGLPPALSYYRDRTGEEIDGVLERGDALVAVEAKSGQTLAEDFFPPLARFEATLPQGPDGSPVETVLVFGGDRNERRGRCRVVSWSHIDDFDWAGA